MSGTSLTPFAVAMRTPARFPRAFDPYQMFRSDMDRLLEDFVSTGAFPALRSLPGGQVQAMMLMPQTDISETERELRITTELPGMSIDDVEVRLDDGVLTIRGEKRSEHPDTEQGHHLMERSYGKFSRSIRLPFSVDPTQVQASFKDGVLTVAVPKPADAQRQSSKIEVKKAEGSEAQPSQSTGAPARTESSPSPANTQTQQAAAA